MKRRILIGVAGLVALLLVVGVPFAIWAFGGSEYPAPTGPHKVGTLELSLTDGERQERLGPDEKAPRELGLRVWYPAEDNASGKRLPIMDGRLAKAFSEQTGAPFGAEDGPPSSSVIDAPPLSKGGRFPVILFSHGGFAHRDQNMSTMEELASHGFIVISIGHTGEAILSLMPGNRAISQNPEIEQGMQAFASDSKALMGEHNAIIARLDGVEDRDTAIVAARELGEVMTKMMAPLEHTPAELSEIRIGDVAFVVEQLRQLDGDDSHLLHGRYDFEHVGIFGHSLGGHTAMSACLDPEIDVDACASLDSALYLLSDRSVPILERPLLVAYAGDADFGLSGSNDFILQGARADTVSVTIDGATHMNFTDMNFMPRFLRLVGVLGPIDGARAATINNDLLLSFFRQHLSGDAQPWLSNPSSRYEELH